MIREIPRAFEYLCNMCGAAHRQENASGHYTGSRPPGWLRIRMATDEDPNPTEDRLFCESCGGRMLEAFLRTWPWAATHVHVKSGKKVEVLSRGLRLEAENVPAVLYQEEDGVRWVRTASVFDDGRFRAVGPDGL